MNSYKRGVEDAIAEVEAHADEHEQHAEALMDEAGRMRPHPANKIRAKQHREKAATIRTVLHRLKGLLHRHDGQ